MKLQKEHDYYSGKLVEWQKRFQGQLDAVAKQLKEFAGKDRMSEAETYMADLKEIQSKIDFFHEEVYNYSSLHDCIFYQKLLSDNKAFFWLRIYSAILYDSFCSVTLLLMYYQY